MGFIKGLFYLPKSDRKVILALLCVIVIALSVIFLTGGENDTSNALVSAVKGMSNFSFLKFEI